MNNPIGGPRRTLGLSKNKTDILKNKKLDIAKKKDRFKKNDNTTSDKEKLLGNSRGEISIEIGQGTAALPPVWVDYYEETLEKLKKIGEITEEVTKLIVQRIKLPFGDHSKLDNQINFKSNEATKLLKECEENHRKICELGRTSRESENDKKVRTNIEKALAIKIQDAAMNLRRQQKGLLDKVKDPEDFTKYGNDGNLASTDHSDDAQEMEMLEDIARGRDQDINKLIDTINELSHLFKQMNQLVIEQGTIVDRIDYNLEQATQSVSKGKLELRKAKKHQTSKCGDYCIKVLVILICIFSVLLLLKFKK
mgnify:CR=1 FL=1